MGLHASTLIVAKDCVLLLIGCFGVWLAVEQHLRPALVSSEHLEDFLVVIIVRA